MAEEDQTSSGGPSVLSMIGVLMLVAGLVAVGVAAFDLIGDDGPASTAPPSSTAAVATTTIPFAPPTSTASEGDGLAYELVADGLNQPVAAALVPGTEDSFYVIERFGRVVVVEGGRLSEVLDITDRVNTEGAEQGLVGIALHPDYEVNGRAFLSYVGLDGPLRIVELERMSEAHELGREERVLLVVEQPGIVHHGGSIQFGPDGMLWIGLGDGGSHRDFLGHAQNPQTLQGSLLRIDVDSRTAALPYGIPPGNAFPDGGGAPEIWAYGLRNPWRFTFDEGRVFIADVGEQIWEEINLAHLGEPGSNFGWAAKNGPECFQVQDCGELDVVDPVVTIPYDGLCAVIGGPVYRGPEIPMFQGQLLWADYCNGFVASIDFEGEEPLITRWRDLGSIHLITGFVVDAAGEVYVVQQSGQIQRIVSNR